MSDVTIPAQRGELFRYLDLEISESTLRATYQLDERTFVESVSFEGVESLASAGVESVAQLWFLLAGLSYYKTAAPRRIDFGATPMGEHARTLLRGALYEGLGEFAYTNQLPLDDVTFTGGRTTPGVTLDLDEDRVLVPFGGGIDSVVTTEQLAQPLDQALFVVSPSSGRFAPLEATAALTGRDIIRATRTLDAQLLTHNESFFHGHVPITAMVTLLAAVAAVATKRGGVVLSNEYSSSVANLRWGALEINHQWAKSWDAERLLAQALHERVGDQLVAASFLRDRSEVWVAKIFSQLDDFHPVFRSCNRAFTQDRHERLENWCGVCDKCLFINLMLAPFLSRRALRAIFVHEPLADPQREEQLRVLVGASTNAKPFECVGDPGECAAALLALTSMSEWSDVPALTRVARDVRGAPTLPELLKRQGPSRVPTHWLR